MKTNYSKFLSFSDSQVTPSLQQLCDSGKESNMIKKFGIFLLVLLLVLLLLLLLPLVLLFHVLLLILLIVR